MSAKRRADNPLGPDNWDKEEPAESDEDGGFKIAPKEVLEKRVIRTAKRRSLATGDGAQKPIFSAFSGFNKTQKSSFDFLANLTNGKKSINDSIKSDNAAVSSSSTITHPASSPSSGIFSLPATSTTKSAFGQLTSESTLFDGSGSTPAFTQSVFSSSKPDVTINDNPFKGQSLSSKSLTNFTITSNGNSENPISQVSSSLFGVPSTNVSNNKSPFSTKNNSQPATSSNTTVTSSTQSTEFNKPAKPEKELIYYSNLKGLNESVSAWIKKHVEETPVCILSPIFRDYEKHLKNIKDEYEKSKTESSSKDMVGTNDTNKETIGAAVPGNAAGLNVFSSSPASTNTIFSLSSNTKNAPVEKPNIIFGINTSTTSANNFATSSTGFSFGIKSSSDSTSPFATNTTTSGNNSCKLSISSSNNISTAATPSAGFSFGIKPSSNSTSPFATNTTTSGNNSCKLSISSSNNISTAATPSAGFSFGIKPSSNSTSPFVTTTTTSANNSSSPSTTSANNFAIAATPTAGFSFGIKPSSTSPFATNTTASANNGSTPSTTSANNFATPATPSAKYSFGIKLSDSTSPFATNTTSADNSSTQSTTSANNMTGATEFSFGIKPSTSTSPFASTTTGNASTFSFSINTGTNNSSTPSTSPFSASTTIANNSSTPFSFGIGKPFSFNSNIKKNDEPTNENKDNEDEPPKVEYTPIAEENSVYDKKCKVFVKKDGKFIDMGIGTLYIKKIEESGKHQFLVRANTSLGNVLVNLILSSSLPTQRMGKNNIMMVCIPTPDSKPPPTPILIRVKTSEDADELLETLNKYKA